MCSRPFRPLGLPIYVARVPAAPFARRYASRLDLDHSVAAATSRQLPSCVAVYPRDAYRDVFYVADPISSIPNHAPGFPGRICKS